MIIYKIIQDTTEICDFKDERHYQLGDLVIVPTEAGNLGDVYSVQKVVKNTFNSDVLEGVVTFPVVELYCDHIASYDPATGKINYDGN